MWRVVQQARVLAARDHSGAVPLLEGRTAAGSLIIACGTFLPEGVYQMVDIQPGKGGCKGVCPSFACAASGMLACRTLLWVCFSTYLSSSQHLRCCSSCAHVFGVHKHTSGVRHPLESQPMVLSVELESAVEIVVVVAMTVQGSTSMAGMPCPGSSSVAARLCQAGPPVTTASGGAVWTRTM